ncbi:extracellular solute-binding protein [Acidimangrovimonas sediminis]|uniref:extracellular solute-binding protein n=1 Tax=Acidimangrovimonas sediminis TaxID=2056283 RepID=UPI000C7F8C9B|nr:extracellular solute-binding protein [Acidimangrovimonas sediminis]
MTKDPEDRSTGVSRRELLALGGATAGVVSLSSLATLIGAKRAAAAGVDKLNLVSWGGAYQTSQIEAYQKPYTDKYKVGFNNIEKSGNGPALLTAQEQSGNISWDIVDMLQADANRLYEQGMLEEIVWNTDLDKGSDGKPAWEDFTKGSLSGGDDKSGGFVSTISYNTMFGYNKEAFPNGAPQTIKDVYDFEKFPGKRGLEKIPAGNLEWALYADGVDKDKIYDVLATPEGVDKAFKKLDEMKPHAVWWSQGAQPPQMLAQKEVTIASAYNGRIFNAIASDNQPFGFIWDGGLYEWDGWVIPAGLPKDRLEEAKRFLRFSTTTQALIDQAKYIAYSPARQSSFAQMGDLTFSKNDKIKMMDYMPTSPDHLKSSIAKSASFWSNYGPQLSERFSSWLAS